MCIFIAGYHHNRENKDNCTSNTCPFVVEIVLFGFSCGYGLQYSMVVKTYPKVVELNIHQKVVLSVSLVFSSSDNLPFWSIDNPFWLSLIIKDAILKYHGFIRYSIIWLFTVSEQLFYVHDLLFNASEITTILQCLRVKWLSSPWIVFSERYIA